MKHLLLFAILSSIAPSLVFACETPNIEANASSENILSALAAGGQLQCHFTTIDPKDSFDAIGTVTRGDLTRCGAVTTYLDVYSYYFEVGSAVKNLDGSYTITAAVVDFLVNDIVSAKCKDLNHN